jgi:hypothetical protein
MSIGALIAGIRGYLGTYAIYTKGKLNLFYMFTSILGGYNRKKRKP